MELHKREVKGKIRLCVPALPLIGVEAMDIRILFHRQYMLYPVCLLWLWPLCAAPYWCAVPACI